MHRIAGWLFIAASLQLGCETRVSLGNPCASDDECSGGLRCDYGRCRTECDDSADCGNGRYCLTINAAEGVCTLSTDTCDGALRRHCEDGLECVDQACVSPCTGVTNACLPGTSCSVDVAACLPLSVSSPDARMDAPVDASIAQETGPDAFCITSTPVVVAPRTICVGEHFACAIRGAGVVCWGSNDGGQLGDGMMVSGHSEPRDHPPASDLDYSATPVAVSNVSGASLSGVTSIACGSNFACALHGGDVSCWGTMGSNGALGLAESLELEGATAVYAGIHHACARVGSDYRCWGENSFNFAVYPGVDLRFDRRMGSDIVSTSTPVLAPDFAGSTGLEVGSVFTCSLECGGVYCQGVSEGAVCGNTPIPGMEVPVLVANRVVDGVPSDMHAGLFHACLLRDGVVSCWGGNGYQALGRDDDTQLCQTTGSDRCRPNATPITLPTGSTLRFTQLAHGVAATSCAMDATGRVYCWGQNDLGQAGAMNEPGHDWTRLTTPVQVAGPTDLQALEVAVGASSTCARANSGEVLCWGQNDVGQMGLGMADSTLRRVGEVVLR